MLLIKNAAISTGEGNKTAQADIFIEGERIVDVRHCEAEGRSNLQPATACGGLPRPFGASAKRPGGGRNDNTINASGLIAIPGAIDPHVHFDTPGFTHREDFAHGTRAAAAGGVTTVIDMPCTSLPPVTSPASLENKLKVIEGQAYTDFALWGGVSQNIIRNENEPFFHRGSGISGYNASDHSRGGNWFERMDELWETGVVGFKTYMISGMDTFRALTYMELGQVMQYARKIGALVGIHAEDGKLIYERMEEMKRCHPGGFGPKDLHNAVTFMGSFAIAQDDMDLYYLSRAEPAEKNGIELAIGLAKETRAKVHIVHLASGAGAHLIAEWKSRGMDISTETCPHYLTFTHKDFKKYGSLIKTAPVVKEEKDRECLWECLKNGTIDFLATDHAPCRLEEKSTGSAMTDYGGMPGVELMLAFIFSEGYKKGRLSLARLVEITSASAAKRFGLFPRKGSLAVGSDADIVLIDPRKIYKVNASKMHSKAKWTPFHGMKFSGRIMQTILRGKVIYDSKKDIVGTAGYGKWVKR